MTVRQDEPGFLEALAYDCCERPDQRRIWRQEWYAKRFTIKPGWYTETDDWVEALGRITFRPVGPYGFAHFEPGLG